MQEANWQSGIQGIVKQGPVKMKKGFGVWKKRWLVFQRATSYGPTRLVVCSKRESFIKHPFGKKNHTIVLMKDVNNVSKGVTKHGEIKVKIGFNIAKPYMEFICLEAQEDYWVECLGLGKGKEDTLDDDSFRSYLLPAISLNYSGECVLQITNKCLTLFSDEMKRQTIVKWPLEVIRRFSKDHDNKIFFLETGRLSTTGECLFNIRSYWFEEMFKKIVQAQKKAQAQAEKLEAEPIMSYTANDFDYDKSSTRKDCDPKDDSDEDDYLHPIPGFSGGVNDDANNGGYLRAFSVRKNAGRNRCKMTDNDDPNQSLNRSNILSADDKCYLSVRDSTCNIKLEKKEESPYLSMDSSHAKETKAHDDGADQTSQTGAQQLSQGSENISGSLGMDSSHAKETKAHDDGADQTSQTGAQQLSQGSENISGSLGYVCYQDPEVFCCGNPPPASHNLNRQSHQLKYANESAPVYLDDPKDKLQQENTTKTIGEDEETYLDMKIVSDRRLLKKNPELNDRKEAHDPLPIPQLPQRRSFKIPDDVPSPFTQPLKDDENTSDESDDGDYLTPIADLAQMSLKRINSSESVPSSHVNPTVDGSSFA